MNIIIINGSPRKNGATAAIYEMLSKISLFFTRCFRTYLIPMLKKVEKLNIFRTI